MRIAHFDSGLHWDDPNLRWGDPAYLLEPGDPGYVADPTSASFPASNKSTKRKIMPKGDYIKKGERPFSNQLLMFKGAIGDYSALLGVSAAQITAQAADADRYKWELDVAEACGLCSQQWTAWKDITRVGGTFPASGAPLAMAWPSPAPPAVAPGVEVRFRALCQHLKTNANYNPAIGEALGIEGAEISGPDFDTLKPLLKPKASAGGVMVGWGWQGFEKFLGSIEILVDRGDGPGFKFLTIDTTPGYNDTQSLPAAPAKWTYKAVFRQGDQRVGQWSDPVSVNVG
ncbi:MAG TPA: hypothetical protein VGF13_02775 [Verrucomicrobiae bacterium]